VTTSSATNGNFKLWYIIKFWSFVISFLNLRDSNLYLTSMLAQNGLLTKLSGSKTTFNLPGQYFLKCKLSYPRTCTSNLSASLPLWNTLLTNLNLPYLFPIQKTVQITNTPYPCLSYPAPI
jgi:hypothetical protein